MVERGISKSDLFVSEEVDRDICQVVSRSVNHSPSFIDVQTNAIDPSHFPFAFRRTRVLKDGDVGREDCIELCGKGEIVAKPPDGDAALRGKGCYANDKAWSTRYPWLPFDVCWEDPASSASVRSYINNVHPLKDQDFYSALETLITRFISLLNNSLTTIATPSRFWSPRVEPYDRSPRSVPNTQPPSQDLLPPPR